MCNINPIIWLFSLNVGLFVSKTRWKKQQIRPEEHKLNFVDGCVFYLKIVWLLCFVYKVKQHIFFSSFLKTESRQPSSKTQCLELIAFPLARQRLLFLLSLFSHVTNESRKNGRRHLCMHALKTFGVQSVPQWITVRFSLYLSLSRAVGHWHSLWRAL